MLLLKLLLYFKLPIWVSCPLFLLFCITISMLLLRCIRKKFTWVLSTGHHGISGFIFNAVGQFYSILVAFMVFVEWGAYNDLTTHLHNEAQSLRSLFSIAQELPNPEKQLFINNMYVYTQELDKEWDYMAKMQSNPNATRALDDLKKTLIHTDIQKFNNQFIYKQAMDDLQDIIKFRHERIVNNETQMPLILWITLSIMSLVFVGITYFFQTENIILQSCMTASLVTIVALMLYVLTVLDYPFSSALQIGSNIFQHVFLEVKAAANI